MANDREIERTLQRLLKVLQSEKALLLEGKAFALHDLAEDKHKLCLSLDEAITRAAGRRLAPTIEGLTLRVNALALENERLFDAVRTGAADARARIASVMEQRRSVGVYGLAGSKVMMPGSGITKRKTA